MEVPLPTDWRSHVDGNTGLANGVPFPWQYGSDDAVAVDLGGTLDEGESLANVVVTLRKLPNIMETDYTDASEAVTDTTTVGSVVMVRLTGLDLGQYYKLDVLYGPAGNMRGGNTIIQVST